jgi:heme exporter protein A
MTMTVTELACRRGDMRVIEGVSFTLPPGRCLILRGPNGAGKTTLLRTLAGLVPPDAGRIEAPPESIVYAGHADGLKSQLTVTENLAFWARVYGTGDIVRAMREFDLEGLADRQAQHLSAGQKRRLGLARLLVTDRAVWALDEPTVSLDAATVARFADVVGAHCAAGGSAIIATHIDLGIDSAEILDIAPFRAAPGREDSPFLDEAFA